MVRTFQHRITMGEICGVILFALAILYCFWFRSSVKILMGILCVWGLVKYFGMVFHTSYVFTDDRRLVTLEGRKQKIKSDIALSSITEVRPMRWGLFSSMSVLVVYGEGSMCHFTPTNVESFVTYLRKQVEESKLNKND